MGGHGSSRWGDYKRKVRVEDCITLSNHVFSYHALGDLLVCTWMKEDIEVASVSLLISEDLVVIRYTAKLAEGSSTIIREFIPLLRHLSHPHHPYFACPGCGRRCRHLHLPPGQSCFRCRLCHDRSYRTRQEHRKYQSLAKVMAESSPWSVKHWNTFLNNRW